MKKTALFLVSVLLVLGGAAAQNGNSTGRFEWVRGYAPGEHVSIVGSVTDSLGNLYILGSFNFASRWEEGELLLPVTPHGQASNNGDVLIAKISPEGEMVWKKVIHGNVFSRIPHDIKAVGDTAFACLVTMPLACDWGYLYYLDTLVNDSYTLWDQNPTDTLVMPDYPMSAWRRSAKCLALITFDFDGNVLEQHFLQMSYLDRHGEDIIYHVPPEYGADDKLCTEVPENSSFAIDGEGNIYLTRKVNDQTIAGPFSEEGEYIITEGNISAVKFWCDRRLVGIVPADSAQMAVPQILKFSPHFDTLLNSRLVFQSQTADYYPYINTRVDKYGDLYITGMLDGPDSNFLIVDSIRNIYINKTSANTMKGFLVKFDSSLIAKYSISLEDSIIPSNHRTSNSGFLDVAFDYDSNLVFLCASTGRNNTILTYQEEPLERIRNDAFMMTFHIDDDSARLLFYGSVPSVGHSQIFPEFNGDNIACYKNRVFVQSEIVGGLHLPNGTIEWPRRDDWGLGLVIFDYQGNVIEGCSYSAFSPSNRPGPLAIRDSTLYLINKLSSDATFGDIHVPSRGDYFACIAKYVDTSFMTPYVRRVTEDTTIRVEVVQEEWTRVLYPNPTSGRVTVVMNGRPLRELYVAGMDGMAEPLPFSALGDGRYAADLTDRPDGAYVLVMISDDEHAYRSTVILQR